MNNHSIPFSCQQSSLADKTGCIEESDSQEEGKEEEGEQPNHSDQDEKDEGK